ncbi:Sm-like protein [Chlorella vulgaris]
MWKSAPQHAGKAVGKLTLRPPAVPKTVQYDPSSSCKREPCAARLLFTNMAAPGVDVGLGHFVDTTVSVITNDGRTIVVGRVVAHLIISGTLRGYDQATNLILDECHERVYSSKEGVEQLVLGLYVIRGDNIAVIGEVDDDKDAAVDFSQVRAAPLKPVTH